MAIQGTKSSQGIGAELLKAAEGSGEGGVEDTGIIGYKGKEVKGWGKAMEGFQGLDRLFLLGYGSTLEVSVGSNCKITPQCIFPVSNCKHLYLNGLSALAETWWHGPKSLRLTSGSKHYQLLDNAQHNMVCQQLDLTGVWSMSTS